MQITELRDPRQLKCLALYRDPTSATFANLKRSAINAGFDEGYANTLTIRDPEWLSAGMKKDIDRVLKSERTIDRILDVDISFDTKNAIDVAKLKFEVAKFVAKTLAKKKYGEDGEDEKPNVTINITNYGEPKNKDGAIIDTHAESKE